MKSLRTKAIVLARVDYGEADRIITFLTPDAGKLTLMAKGVRRVKSKLAGGIELFSTSDISYLIGKKDVGTLISTQLIKHYGNIVKDIDRVQTGYDMIKQMNRLIEDSAEGEYYELLESTFAALDDMNVDLNLVKLWYQSQLLSLSGHMPNLSTDTKGNKLSAESKYNFDYESVAFAEHSNGRYQADAIKVLRLLFSENKPAQLAGVDGLMPHLQEIAPLVTTLQKTYQHF